MVPPVSGRVVQRNLHKQVVMAAVLAATVAGCASSQPSTTPNKRLATIPDRTPAGLVQRGELLYRANCQSCHGDARTGDGGLPGAPVHGPDGHTWHHSDGNLTDIIQNGSGEMGEMMRGMMGVPPETPRMPAWRGTLTDDDIAAILAFIKTGWTPEQRRFQQETPMMQ
jgi:mono/diheme cytochrome c family protein